MITFFCDFGQFSAKNGRFSKKLHNLDLFGVKNSAKIKKNHNIGPWYFATVATNPDA
jgi:hypothetical protein